MAQTQLSEKLGASGNIFQSDVGYNPQVSCFDLSRKLSTTLSEGAIVPLDVIRLIPGDKIDYNCRFLLDAMPQAVPPQTNYKLIIQLWKTSLIDLWKGAETFVTRGRSSNIEMTIPTIGYDDLYTDDKSLVSNSALGYYLSTPHGLPTMLGLPPCRYSLPDSGATPVTDTPSYLPYVEKYDSSDTTSPRTAFNCSTEDVNALIPFFYQKICRTMLPTNLLQDCKVWFPDDISNDDWRIASDGSNLSADGHFVPIGTSLPSTPVANFVPHAGNDANRDNCINLWQTRYIQYGDDLFTTAKPWLVRGEETTLDLDVSGLTFGINDVIDYDGIAEKLATADGKVWASLSVADKTKYKDAVGIDFTYTKSPNANRKIDTTNIHFQADTGITRGSTHHVVENFWIANTISGELASSKKRPGISLGSNVDASVGYDHPSYSGILGNNAGFITLKGADVANALGVQMTGTPKCTLTANTLRSLMAFSVKDEIDALTNGNYNSTIKAHFGKFPKHHDFEPQYVGGTVDYIQFGTVMQTSESKADKPLGTVGGIGGTSAGGYLGHIESDDFGYAMVVAYVVPEVTYTDGIEREWTDVTQEDLWFPEWSNLGFQPLLNKEIKLSGTASTDNDLFGYQTRGIEYKQRRNRVSGLFQLHPDEDMMFSAYTQARLFDSTPELSNEFTTCSPKNMRRDYLAFPEMPSYRFQFASDVKAVRPLPYKSVPARMGI